MKNNTMQTNKEMHYLIIKLLLVQEKQKKEMQVATNKFYLILLKIYSVGESEKAVSKITFPSYERYHNINKAYSNFFQEMIEVGNNIAHLKTSRIKKKQGMV